MSLANSTSCSGWLSLSIYPLLAYAWKSLKFSPDTLCCSWDYLTYWCHSSHKVTSHSSVTGSCVQISKRQSFQKRIVTLLKTKVTKTFCWFACFSSSMQRTVEKFEMVFYSHLNRPALSWLGVVKKEMLSAWCSAIHDFVY
jgi:hypothetical protein